MICPKCFQEHAEWEPCAGEPQTSAEGDFPEASDPFPETPGQDEWDRAWQSPSPENWPDSSEIPSGH